MNNRKPFRNLTRLAGDLLTYNRTERRGILVLGTILCGVILANVLLPAGTTVPATGNPSFLREVAAFEAAWKHAADSDSLARIHRYAREGWQGKPAYSGGALPGRIPSPPALLLELNSSDTLDLQQLRGIGPGFARRIVQYRSRLHGYRDKKQLLEIPGMDTSRYNLIADHVWVNADSVHPLDLNTVTFKELIRHPYFPFPATKNIMLYRQKNKTIRSAEELKGIPGVTDSLFRRMVGYIRF
ncbi:MAG TPA: helix-hairpin-helix domain-containing protein [Bacteroidales bacterium]|nr:helix-hairpin-helix domain-containing protein [Bacteroidales bacterium]HPS61791.1 helix-hairpin-helix domain-containing protein [Bacteroidales bacterium]